MKITKDGHFILGICFGGLISYCVDYSMNDLPFYPMLLFLIVMIITLITCREDIFI
jgi:hypothetical protein